MFDDLPDAPLEQAQMLENVLLTACEGNRDKNAAIYRQLRQALMQDPTLKALLPQDVRTCRDIEHFWQHIKTVSPTWNGRRLHVRDRMAPLFQHLEGRAKAAGV